MRWRRIKASVTFTANAQRSKKNRPTLTKMATQGLAQCQICSHRRTQGPRLASAKQGLPTCTAALTICGRRSAAGATGKAA